MNSMPPSRCIMLYTGLSVLPSGELHVNEPWVSGRSTLRHIEQRKGVVCCNLFPLVVGAYSQRGCGLQPEVLPAGTGNQRSFDTEFLVKIDCVVSESAPKNPKTPQSSGVILGTFKTTHPCYTNKPNSFIHSPQIGNRQSDPCDWHIYPIFIP